MEHHLRHSVGNLNMSLAKCTVFSCPCFTPSKEKLDLIANSGANVVLSRLAIGDLATQHHGFERP